MDLKLFDSIHEAKKALENNKPRQVRADGKEICIVRKGEEIFAFQDACAHMGENLHKGNTNPFNEIVCPLHAYRFHMKTGEECEGRCSPLKIYPIIENEEGVFIRI
ncbi:MAG: Rieske (2Fe-2S) protein [Ekhidna sp.]|uniref:Rieske (2Fe-2S) protein n=1 Tax=Ekhidna sp. TaxID=2608089 RepID=UPI0032EB5247